MILYDIYIKNVIGMISYLLFDCHSDVLILIILSIQLLCLVINSCFKVLGLSLMDLHDQLVCV